MPISGGAFFDSTLITWDETYWTFDGAYNGPQPPPPPPPAVIPYTTDYVSAQLTFDRTAIGSATITWDSINYSFDGADFINGGASDVIGLPNYSPSVSISVPLFVPLYGAAVQQAPFLPVTFPPMTYVVNGVTVQSGET